MHNIRYVEYPCQKTEKQILKDVNTWAFDGYESQSYHGNLRFHRDIICKNRDEAMEKIERLDKGWYDDHAVFFKDGRYKRWLVKVEWHS